MRFARRFVATAVVVAAMVATMNWTTSGTASAATGASAPAGDTVGAHSGFAAGGWMLLWGTDAELARDLDAIAATGAKWVRFDFDWASAEPSPGQFNWGPIDRVVTAVRARGLEVLATPAYTPGWARPTGTTDKTPPTDLATYATFVGAAAA